MKLETAVTGGIPHSVIKALVSKEFAETFIIKVCGDTLGIEDQLSRPAEFHVQVPNFTVNLDFCLGVEARLTGLTRAGRTAKQFHDAVHLLHVIVAETVSEALKKDNSLLNVQVFCCLMIDGDVETSPGSGEYSNVLESKAVWVNGSG